MACRDWAAKVGGGVLGRVWALIAALALLLGLAALAPAPAQAASFRDVPSGQWYTSWVDKASDLGLMSGFTDPATGRPTGYFGPDEPLTRAQVATVLWRMAGGPSSGHASFPDVERGSWYDAPVAWCVKAGVVTGYTSGPDRGYFRPDRPVTRQELATMVYRYAKYAGMDVADPDPSAFRSTTDWRTVDSWASEALTWTAAAGVLSGVDNHDGTYSVVPFGTATRAMAAKVFVVLSGSPSAAKASYTVTFNSNGGSAVKAQTVKNGAKASKPADPAKSGYLFKGWYSDKSLTKAFNFNSTVKSNLTLYAKWEAKATYTVTFNANGGTAVKAQSVSSGAKASKPANPTKAGHAFKGWYSDKSLTKAYDFNSAVKSNLTLYAKWETQPYAVLYKDGLLSLQAGTDTDPSHGEVLGKWAWDGSSSPWYSKRARVRSVVARDGVAISNGYGMFSGLMNCKSMDLSKLDVSNVSDLRCMFEDCSSLTSLDISGWDASNVIEYGSSKDYYHDAMPMFSGCTALRSLDLSGWGTGSARRALSTLPNRSALRELRLSDASASGEADLSEMFKGCSSLTSLDLSGWDVSNASDLRCMFEDCSSLTSLDVSGWDVSNGSDLHGMFYGCSSLTSLDLSGWDVSSATDLSWMFFDCSSLTSLDLSGWDVSNARSLYAMFYGCSSLTSLDVSGWDVSKVTWFTDPSHSYFGGMFYGCSSLTSLDVSGWDVSRASDLSYMFAGCSSLTSLDLSGWDVSNVTRFTDPSYGRSMFYGCSRLQSLDLSGWDVSGASDLSYMFEDCSSLTSLDLSGWDISGVPDLRSMFYGCSRLQSLDLSGWDVSSATDLSWMFNGCSSLTSLDLSGWDVSSATDLSSVFCRCSSLTSLDVSGWDVSSATNLSYMFAGCSSLTSLDLSGWDVSGASDLSGMFKDCSSLTSLDLSGWDVSSATHLSYMFSGCSSLGTVALGAGCDVLVEKLPSGPWYDAEGKEYDRPPAGVAGTFTKTKPAALAVAADVVSDAEALLPAQIVEGEQDGLRYVVVPEGASFEYGLEYPELAGRYVGPGVYLTGYAGEGDSLVVPLEVAGVPVVSANLSWNDSDRAGMTRLASVSFERVESKASSLVQLDVSGNGLSSLDVEGLDALVRLNCEANPIADLAALQAWAAQDGHEAKLPQVQDAAPAEPGGAAAPSEPSAPEQPSEPDAPAVEPGESSEPEVPAEPEVPGEPEVPSEPEAPAEPEAPSEPEEPSVEPAPDEGSSDELAASDEADPASDSLELGEDPVSVLAA